MKVHLSPLALLLASPALLMTAGCHSEEPVKKTRLTELTEQTGSSSLAAELLKDENFENRCKAIAKELGQKYGAKGSANELLAKGLGYTVEQMESEGPSVYSIDVQNIFGGNPRVVCTVYFADVVRTPSGPRLICSGLDSDYLDSFDLSISDDQVSQLLANRPDIAVDRVVIVVDITSVQRRRLAIEVEAEVEVPDDAVAGDTLTPETALYLDDGPNGFMVTGSCIDFAIVKYSNSQESEVSVTHHDGSGG